MTALERKQNTEELLKEFNIILKDQLPPLEEETDVVLRSAQEVGKRIIILTYLSCAGQQEYLREEIIEFLKKENIWDAVSPQEQIFFTKTELSEDDKTSIAWRSEAILFLLWTIEKVETLGLPTEEVDVNEMVNVLPVFFKFSGEFINTSMLRPVGEILDQADLAFRLQWASREADTNNFPFNGGVLYERYHAANWVARIEPEWD
jgi:hypothetical protein